MRRPLSNTNVLPAPKPRRLNEPTSPRASLTLEEPVVSPKLTEPICGIERSNSSPDTAAEFSMSDADITVMGKVLTSAARLIFEPTTEILSISSSLTSAFSAAKAT